MSREVDFRVEVMLVENSYRAFNNIFGKIGRIVSKEVIIALIKSKCLPILLYGTEACSTNSAVRHSLDFAFNKVLFKIFGALSNDTYRNICNHFGYVL